MLTMTKKLPTAVKETNGTARADRQNPDEPRPPVGEPGMPPDLSAAEQAAWAECVRMLLPLGVLTESDGLALESLACAVVEYRELRQAVSLSKTTAVTSTQKEVVDRLHPLYPMLQQTRKELRALWGCFGLDPLSRTSVHTVVKTAKKTDAKPGQGAQAEPRPASTYFAH